MSDWIRALAVSFARRLVQEAEMQEAYTVYFRTTRDGKAWLDNWGYTLDQAWERRQELLKYYPFVSIIPMEDTKMSAQELISRMCAAPLVIQYEEGEIIHTDDKPFCLDPACPCHEDREAINAVNEAVEAGILTHEEATRLMAGKQV